MKKIIVFSFAILAATAGLFQSCKKFTNLPPYNETYSSDTLANGKRKMLVIAIDGIRGQELQNDSGKLMPLYGHCYRTVNIRLSVLLMKQQIIRQQLQRY